MFNPCGMVWTYLRACYKFSMRLFIGGREQEFPARWYFCADGALPFPGLHGAEASPWLKTSLGEVNAAWGEVTPFPTDPGGTAGRGLDRGLNPGYRGKCFIGDPQWFVDGNLPASVLTPPAPPLAGCCQASPQVSTGGIVLAGFSTLGRGGIVNTCVLCGGGAPRKRSATFSGGTGVWTPLNREFDLVYVSGCTWRFGGLPGSQIELVGRFNPVTWNLTVSLPAPPRGATYTPKAPFDCVFGAPYSLTSSNPPGAPPSLVVGT